MQKYLQLNDIDCYKRALALSNYVWDIVVGWDWFSKQAVGAQFVTAVDSISANIAEGFGRTQYNHVLKELQLLPKEIHQLIKCTDMRLKD